MNRYVFPFRFRRSDVWALALLLEAAFMRWLCAISTKNNHLWAQIPFSEASAVLGWAAFVVIFNEGFVLASRQQSFALLFSVSISLLYEMSNFLIVK